MIIQHNISAMNSFRQLGANNNALAKNLEKLSSGYKVNRAADDAGGLAVSEKMRAQLRGLETAQKNANDGISVVQTAEGALTEVHSMLNRMSEIAGLAANGIYTSTDLANYQAEIDSLISEIDRIACATNFNGVNLLAGSYSKTLQIGDTADSYNQLKVAISDMQATGAVLGLSNLSVADAGDAANAIKTIKDAIEAVSTQRGKLGAIQNRLDHTINNLGATTENLTAAEARIRDTDMAKEMTAYTKNNILVQAAQAMLAQANQVPQGVLQLLR